MNYPAQPPKPPVADVQPANDLLTRALGERQKLSQIKDKYGIKKAPPRPQGQPYQWVGDNNG